MSSNEVLEVNLVGLRADFNELKTDFREFKVEIRAVVTRLDDDLKSAVARLDSDIKSAVTKLELEIRAMGAKAEKDLEKFATRIETQLVEMRAEQKGLREKVDKNTEQLNQVGTKLTVLLWLIGGLSPLIMVVVTVGKALHWF